MIETLLQPVPTYRGAVELPPRETHHLALILWVAMGLWVVLPHKKKPEDRTGDLYRAFGVTMAGFRYL